MKTSFPLRILLVLAALSFMASARGGGAPFSIDFTVHEDGMGTFSDSSGTNGPLPSAQQADPGPGGRSNALTFGLLAPPALMAGDLLLLDPVTNQISDVIRFNPMEAAPAPDGRLGTLVFYSLAGGGMLADTGFPSLLYANNFSLIENTLGATLYTPTAGQPGFIAGTSAAVTYHIFSEELAVSGVPETGSSLTLMSLALLVVIPFSRRCLAAR